MCFRGRSELCLSVAKERSLGKTFDRLDQRVLGLEGLAWCSRGAKTRDTTVEGEFLGFLSPRAFLEIHGWLSKNHRHGAGGAPQHPNFLSPETGRLDSPKLS